MEAFCFSVVCLKKWSPFTSIVLDLAAMLFTPETEPLKCFVDSKPSPTPPSAEW